MEFTENSGCTPTGKTVPIHINGRDIITNLTFDVLKPSTNEVLYQASAASEPCELTFITRETKYMLILDILDAINTANRAFPAWRDTAPATKRDILLRAATIIEERSQELGSYSHNETGADLSFSIGFDIPLAAQILKDVAGRISHIEGSIPMLSNT